MLENNTIVKVTNRDNGSIGYTIPDLNNLHREFAPGETKELTVEEMRKLSYIRGGDVLLKEYLTIDNKELIKELLSGVEPEYYYTKEDVKNLLLTGSLDAFKDCLDFAPEGVIDLVKQMAVELNLNDVAKREAILKATGFNVTNAIELRRAAAATEEPKEEKKATGRRVTPSTETKGRRVVILSDKK